MKNEIEGKYRLAIELIQETIDFMVETGVPLEIIANLDIALDIIEEMNATALDDKIESDLEIDVISYIGYDIINQLNNKMVRCQDSLYFLDLAKETLMKANRPLTQTEIWIVNTELGSTKK